MARLGGFDDSQRLQIDTGGPETVAAALKALFHGGDSLRGRGIRVESLAIIDSIDGGTIKFRR